MNSNTPIVLIHKGNSLYLIFTILALKRTHPYNQIILLGDFYNSYLNGLVEYHPYKNYFYSSDKLAENFANYSTNGGIYELFCLQRWLILSEFMQAKHLNDCLYLDSDVLVFSNLPKELAAFSSKKSLFTLCGTSPHLNYITSLQGLNELCDIIIDFYEDGNIEKVATTLKEHFKSSNVGGISDMTFFNIYKNKYEGTVIDLFKEGLNSKILFDISIQESNGFKIDQNELKYIQFTKDIPYAISLNEEKIRTISLHFQGVSKRALPALVYRFLPLNVKFKLIIYLLLWFFYKVLYKFSLRRKQDILDTSKYPALSINELKKCSDANPLMK